MRPRFLLSVLLIASARSAWSEPPKAPILFTEQQRLNDPETGKPFAREAALARQLTHKYGMQIGTDGVLWTVIPGSSITLSFPPTLSAGLAVTSHNAGALSTVAFISVAIG